MGMTSYRSRFRQRAEDFQRAAERAKADQDGDTEQEQPSDDGGES